MCWKLPGLSTISGAKQRLNLSTMAALPSSPPKASSYPRLSLGRRRRRLSTCAVGRPLEAVATSSLLYTARVRSQLRRRSSTSFPHCWQHSPVCLFPFTITGDMNVNLEQALDPEAVKYSTILSTYNFRQHVKTSTHRSGSLLDHVITPESAFPPDVLITDVGLSDHMLLSWSINMTPPSPTYVTITRRKWQHFDAGAFLAELSKSELCADSEPATDISADVDHLAAMFNSEIIGLLAKHAPVAEFTVRECAHQPWFDSECREARRKARRLVRRCHTNT